MATSGKLPENSSVLSRRLKVDGELDDRTSGDRVFQTRATASGKARSPTMNRFDVGTANVSDDHDCSRCFVRIRVARGLARGLGWDGMGQ